LALYRDLVTAGRRTAGSMGSSADSGSRKVAFELTLHKSQPLSIKVPTSCVGG
jgi:hypothetical protein